MKPRIVSIFGKFILDDTILGIKQYGLMMEFMEGGSLKLGLL